MSRYTAASTVARALAAAMGVMLAATLPVHAGRLPARGGGLDVYVPATAAGIAIADAFVERACGSFTVHPDGRVTRLAIPPDGLDWSRGTRPDGVHEGSFQQTDDGELVANGVAAWPPLLDGVRIRVGALPARPRDDAILVRPGRPDDDPDTPFVTILYRAEIDPGVPVELCRSVRALLAPYEFRSLMPDHALVELPPWQPPADVGVTAHADVRDRSGDGDGLVARRAAVVLARGHATNGGPPIDVHIVRDVLFEPSPATDRLLDATEHGWPLVALRYTIEHGDAARGPLGSPYRLWLTR